MKFALATIIVTLVIASANSVSGAPFETPKRGSPGSCGIIHEEALFLLEIARQQRKCCEDQGKKCKLPCQ